MSRIKFVLVSAAMLAVWWSVSVGADQAASAPSAIRVACVGDSITFGAGISDRTKTYPEQLGKLLGEKYEVRNFGVSGTTLLAKGDNPYIKVPAHAKALEFKPQIVVIMLGTNDTKPQNWKNKADFAEDYKALIAEFRKANPDVKVYLCTPVPAFPGAWGINDADIKELAPVVREVAKEAKAVVIDLYAALDGKKELFPDKVHPNAEGAGLMAKEIAAILTAQAASRPAGAK